MDRDDGPAIEEGPIPLVLDPSEPQALLGPCKGSSRRWGSERGKKAMFQQLWPSVQPVKSTVIWVVERSPLLSVTSRKT